MESRRTPTAAGFAALFVGVLALAAIAMLLLQHDDATGTARRDAAATDTVAVPIQMITVHGADPAPAADGSDRSNGSVQLQGQTGPVLSLVFTADESMMAGTDRAGNAHVWNRAGRLLATVTPASGLRISSVSITPKGQQFATVSSDGSVRLWPLPSGS